MQILLASGFRYMHMHMCMHMSCCRGSGLDRSASWRVPAFVPPSGGLYGSAPAHYAEQPENPRRRQAGGAGVGLRAVGRRGDSTGRRSARADRANCPASVLVSECRLGTPASD